MIPSTRLLAALSADVVAALSGDGETGLPAPDVLHEALEGGEREVRAALSGHAVEVGGALHPHLVDHAVTLAVEHLFHRRREMIPGPWTDRAARVRTILTEMAAGRHPLPGQQPGKRIDGPTTPPPSRNPALKKW